MVFICPAAVFFILQIPAFAAPDGIDTYYVRYDIIYVNHRVADENLLMVPAQNEFRMEKFSQVRIAGVISMTPRESKNRLWTRARDQALKQLLRSRGLTSVETRNMATIVSYEGVVRTPVQIVPDAETAPAGPENPPVFSFTAGTWFAPLAFPDQWQRRETKALMRKKIEGFLELIR